MTRHRTIGEQGKLMESLRWWLEEVQVRSKPHLGYYRLTPDHFSLLMQDIREAADEIEGLRAENKSLRHDLSGFLMKQERPPGQDFIGDEAPNG